MNLREYVLPENLATYAMYGESIGDAELELAYDKWIVTTMQHEGLSQMHLVDVKDCGFMRWHELKDIGSCDTGIFVFYVVKKKLKES